MTDERFEYACIDGDDRLYRITGYTSNGDVLLLAVSGQQLYTCTIAPINNVVPIDRESLDAAIIKDWYATRR